MEGIELEEGFENLFRRLANGLQQDGDRHLAATVNAEEEDVLRIELEVQPGTAVRNDAGREQQLARAMGLAAVMLKEHAGRTVQLRNDDALGTVDDEGARGGHERNFAHVHFLLLHFLDLFGARLTVENHQTHLGAQGAGKGQAALLAFLDVKSGFAKLVLDKFQTRIAGVGNDREDGVECGLEALDTTLHGRQVDLQELGVRLKLGGQQERYVQYGRTFRKTLANALLLGIRVGHESSNEKAIVKSQKTGLRAPGRRNTLL